MDPDLEGMSHKDLLATLRRLRSLIRKVVTQKGDDLCWRDVYIELANELPEKPTVDFTPPPEIFLPNCQHFEKCMGEGSPYFASDCPLRQKGCPGLKVQTN